MRFICIEKFTVINTVCIFKIQELSVLREKNYTICIIKSFENIRPVRYQYWLKKG